MLKINNQRELGNGIILGFRTDMKTNIGDDNIEFGIFFLERISVIHIEILYHLNRDASNLIPK